MKSMNTDTPRDDAKHTPGPLGWALVTKDGRLVTWNPTVYTFNPVGGGIDVLRETADKTDSDAAPHRWEAVQCVNAHDELVEALRPFANYACEPPCNCHNCRARAAIAKATGRNQ